MPYGIPYATPEINAKMERCVEKLMRDGYDEDAAIKICKANIMKAEELGKYKKEE